MGLTKPFVSLLCMLFCSAPALADVLEGGTGLAYGDDHAYFLTAPAGWMLDTESAAPQNLFAVFYPKGSSWNNGAVVMYSNAAAREGRTAKQAIQHDYEFLKKKSPKLVMEDVGTLTTRDNKQAMIRYFKSDNWGNAEAIGYVIEPKIVANIVMTARNKTAFESALPAFRQLIASYRFVTDKPNKVDLCKLVKAEHNKDVQSKLKRSEHKGSK